MSRPQGASGREGRSLRPALFGVALSLSLFQLYTAGIQPLGLFYQRSIHLALILVLAFLSFPSGGRGRPRHFWGRLVDAAFISAGAYSGLYLSYHLDEIIERAGFWSPLDIAVGAATVVTVLEASRRVIGWPITLVGIAFILYAYTGPYLPGVLQHRGYSTERVVAQLYLGQEGIYGIPLGVAATYVFIFVLFGAFLEVTGAGKFFIDLAYSLTGSRRGGPAKAAVVASAFMGSISGSAVANVVTSGAFTIPTMKKLGYKPEEAAGVEAAASTGGQIMPPIMGAGAFLIAEYTGVPYLEIVKLSILPAFFYFATVYVFVDIIAAKRGMTGLPASALPRWKKVMRGGWYFLLPLAVLVYFLVLGVSPARVGFIAVVSVVFVAALRGTFDLLSRHSEEESRGFAGRSEQALRLGLAGLVAALEKGARAAVPVSLACAVAGIVVGIVGLTGLGLQFSSLMLSFSFGNIVLALFLVGLASLLLGIGLPVTASYIVLIVLAGPALVNDFGLPLIVAHLVVFWYSQDSNVTPPVALAAFAASGIAGSDPIRSGLAAWKFAKGLYLIPLFLVFNPEIVVGGPVPLVVWNAVTALLALGAFAASLEGYLFAPLRLPSRLLAAAGTVAIFYPGFGVELAGAGLIAAVVGTNYLQARAARRAAAGQARAAVKDRG